MSQEVEGIIANTKYVPMNLERMPNFLYQFKAIRIHTDVFFLNQKYCCPSHRTIHLTTITTATKDSKEREEGD